MDIEPIYCAEQIMVPPDLADILKAYTKEVIRRQPDDLLEFSAHYFGNLANISRSAAAEVAPPSVDQLQLIFNRAKDEQGLDSQQLEALCYQAGVAKEVLVKAIEAANLDRVNIDIYKLVFFLVSMGCQNFAGLVESLIAVCGDGARLETDTLLRMLAFAQPLDPDFNEEFLGDLALSLQGLSRVSMPDLMNDPQLKAKLQVV